MLPTEDEKEKEESVFKNIVCSDDGHLKSENLVSSSDSNSDDEDGGASCHGAYNVCGKRDSDEALPSTDVSSDEDEAHQSSVREEDDLSTSSESRSTCSNDTGTVADRKPKRFFKKFVVNSTISSSSASSVISSHHSGSSSTDSSDNDTDTEKDCGVVLTYIKTLSDNERDSVERESVIPPLLPSQDEESGEYCSLKDILKGEKSEVVSVTPSPDLSDVSAESHHSSSGEDLQETVTEAKTKAAGEITCFPLTSTGAGDDIRKVGAPTCESSTARAGAPAPVASETCADESSRRGASGNGAAGARYTSLVMITQEPPYPQVSVVTTGTTTLVPDDRDSDVVVRHTNWQDLDFATPPSLEPKVSGVTVVTGADTLSAVVCLEDGLADDDSWVEDLSNNDGEDSTATEDSSSGDEVTLTCSAALDHEDELRGYHRSAIDFTLHTIVEESCEESEAEHTSTLRKPRPASTTDLEKYFFFGLGLGDGSAPPPSQDGTSETSSICSEGMDSLGNTEEENTIDSNDPAELASSRLEKYFLSGFMGFTKERRDSDGSVGSDSEGHPSPEQRRKRLVRARGTGRSHSSSLDNLLANNELSEPHATDHQSNSEDSDQNDDMNSFEKGDGQFDTVKRKKCKKTRPSGSNSSDESKVLESTQEVCEDDYNSDDERNKTPQPTLEDGSKKQQSRDSGFIGSCDDLIKDQPEQLPSELPESSKLELKLELERIAEERKPNPTPPPPATSLTRKDSFNNWSSDEETNLMMCKMRQFFKTLIANSSKPTTPVLGNLASKPVPSPRLRHRYKPPQLVYFESELTRLMKTVPGIKDEEVREIVEYLSSEDTWSDSYDSSDYTSSDLEGTDKTLLQQQISDSCQQIINKFDVNGDQEGDEGDGGIIDETRGMNKETAFVYQKLVASFEKMATGSDEATSAVVAGAHSSPPLIAKVMHHIGSRLVALMHEVSSGESHCSNSPKTKHYHRRLHPKLSNASSTTTEDDDSTSDNNLTTLEDPSSIRACNLLPRSKSHDLLLGETRNLHQSSSGVSDIAEEKEASDYERFSWRGSFESALMASDSRNKLSIIGSEGSASASALAVAAKRRSAGDLMFNHKSLSREQLDRVRSCGSIGGGGSEDKLWVSSSSRTTRRRSSVPDAASGSGGSADGEDDDEDEDLDNRATLPRSLQMNAATTNSLPRLPTTTVPSTMYKAHSMYHFLQQNVKSARYRPPGFNKSTASAPKRAVSAPGLQPSHPRRGRRSQPSSAVASGESFCLINFYFSVRLFRILGRVFTEIFDAKVVNKRVQQDFINDYYLRETLRIQYFDVITIIYRVH